MMSNQIVLRNVRRRSITYRSSRMWLIENELSFQDYLRENHNYLDHDDVIDLMFNKFPDEGKKLVQNFSMTPFQKLIKFLDWLIFQSQITCLVFGDQCMGKDASLCRVFERLNLRMMDLGIPTPRYVTLGNIKRPPFVNSEDMFFSFKDIPFGTSKKPVFIYASELDSEFPSREHQGQENKLFSILQNTMRQNHQKLFGCIKLASQVDISVLRSCNAKMFKYISPEKLEIEGVERVNILSDLGRWFLPKDVNDKSDSLMAFDNNLLTGKWRLPSFWSDEYSEQFNVLNIDPLKIKDFVRSKMDDKDKLTPTQIYNLQTMVYQKFRTKLSASDIQSYAF